MKYPGGSEPLDPGVLTSTPHLYNIKLDIFYINRPLRSLIRIEMHFYKI